MKIPKRPNYKTKPYSTNEEIEQWNDFVTLLISIMSLIVSISIYFLK